LQKDGTLVRVVDMSKGQAGGAAGGAPAGAAGANGAPAAGGTASAGSAAGGGKSPDAAPAKEAGKGKMPPVTGENPCLRGLNATR